MGSGGQPAGTKHAPHGRTPLSPLPRCILTRSSLTYYFHASRRSETRNTRCSAEWVLTRVRTFILVTTMTQSTVSIGCCMHVVIGRRSQPRIPPLSSFIWTPTVGSSEPHRGAAAGRALITVNSRPQPTAEAPCTRDAHRPNAHALYRTVLEQGNRWLVGRPAVLSARTLSGVP